MESFTKCIDFASNYCPCKLAEMDHCLVCSQCAKTEFCNCSGVAGFCVLQELRNNGNRAKEPRKTYRCRVGKVIPFGDRVRLVLLAVPDELAPEFSRPGSFAFLRTAENAFFEVPLSVLFSEIRTVSFAIILKGIKTSMFRDLKAGDEVFLRAPYWNGTLGQKSLAARHGGKALVLVRGIGFLPSVAVIDQLRRQKNELAIYMDSANFPTELLEAFRNLFEINTSPCKLSGADGLTDEAREIIRRALADGTEFIHVGGSDFLIGEVVRFLKELQRDDVALSCCNNARMCCGEGICGACTRDDAREVRHLCKEQFDPYAFGGRN